MIWRNPKKVHTTLHQRLIQNNVFVYVTFYNATCYRNASIWPCSINIDLEKKIDYQLYIIKACLSRAYVSDDVSYLTATSKQWQALITGRLILAWSPMCDPYSAHAGHCADCRPCWHNYGRVWPSMDPLLEVKLSPLTPMLVVDCYTKVHNDSLITISPSRLAPISMSNDGRA